MSDDEESAEDKIRKFVESSRSKETNRKTELWIIRFKQHCEKQHGVAVFDNLNKTELNTLLCSFIIEAKKQNGDGYETTTIHCMFSVIGRFFKDHQLGEMENDTEFQGARDVKKAKLKMLKADGKGNKPNRAMALTKEEEDILYEAGQFGCHNPESPQRTVWWQTTLLFGHRERDESRQMAWGDVTLQKDETGKEYLQFSERCTKTRDGDTGGGSKAFAPKACEYPEEPSRCPVRTYKEFAKRRPIAAMRDDSPFYLAINHKRREEDNVWYSSAPLGKNTLGKLLKTACQKAGIAGQKTNHSARKACVKRALEAGCPREYVAQLTGHKNVSSLENYVEADISVQKAMCTSVQTGASFSMRENKELKTCECSVASPAITFNITNCENVTVVHKG